jgi:hypothetical protein
MEPSLQALLANLIDYAGLYPPAGLPLPQVVENYSRYLDSPNAWMLNRLVLPASKLSEVTLQPGWRVTLLVDSEPGSLPPQVETLETKLPHRLSLPTYCEAPVAQIDGAFAKVRTGGLRPEAVPSTEILTEFLCGTAHLRVPFKATAGLHHPMRSQGTGMHGFLNVFVAAGFAWHGEYESIPDMLEEEDPKAFKFVGDVLHWRDYSLSTEQIQAARRDFAHSFGSCSFEEPIADLRELGLL